MTVNELVDILRKCDSDVEVVVQADYPTRCLADVYRNIHDIEEDRIVYIVEHPETNEKYDSPKLCIITE